MQLGRRFWPDQLTEPERAVLRRTGAAPPPRPDVLVVGGGILGVTIARAFELAGAGTVVLLEAGELGCGATGGAAGLLTPEPHHGIDPPELVELGRVSLDAWRVVHDSTPGGVGLVDLDWLALAPGAEYLAAARSPTMLELDSEQVAGLVPGLASTHTGLLVRDQARVNPLRAAARIADRLDHVCTGVQATGAIVRDGKLDAVETTVGTFHPGSVVFATGIPPRLEGIPPAPPADYVKGHILATEPASFSLPGTVDPVATQVDDSRLIMGGTLDVGDSSPTVKADVIAAMMSDAAGVLPALSTLGVSHAWCCFRPHHPDGLPVIDRLDGTDNAWFTSGHYRTGILMAPATASILADWSSTGKRPAPAVAFSADRFGR